jgi:phosphatidate cytidylyltransferase
MQKETLNRILTSLVLLPVLFYATIYSSVYLIALLIIAYSLCVYEVIKNTKNIFFNFFANIILGISFYAFYYLRGETEYSLIILFWILTSTFFSDIGGYIFGKVFKGRKLTKISPKKTISGAIGAFVFSLFLFIFFSLIFENINLTRYLILTLIVSAVSQIGDIFISFIKRKAKVKNTSDILPGHGGLLDRLDGILFAIPIGLNLAFFL